MSEERNVVLWCGVYDLATVFPVEIALSATVFSLKIDIATMVNHSPIFTRLYMARDTNGSYLKENDDCKVMLHGPVQEHFAVMLPSWTLSDYFEPRFTPQPREIHVLVKLLQTSPLSAAVRPEYELFINMDHEFLDGVRPYEAVAMRLKEHPLVEKLAQELVNVTTYPIPSPVVVLENSLGTGKTQMAFNLAAHGRFKVFHVLCTQQGDISQSVYKAFLTRSESFRACVEKDLACLDNGSPLKIAGMSQLHTFGFISAALRGDAAVRGPASRFDVMNEIQCRQERGDKPLVFFLDEFQSVVPASPYLPKEVQEKYHQERRERNKYLCVMQNVFRACSLPVVTSSTSGSTTSDHFVPGDVSRGGSPVLWCLVFPSLPPTSLGSDENEDVPLPDQVKRILEHSRPIFVSLAWEYARAKPCTSNTDPLAYFNGMIEELALQLGRLKEDSGTFLLGQFGMLLGTSFEQSNASANIVRDHFAHLRETQPFQLTADFDVLLRKDRDVWQSWSVLPPLADDILLHLVLSRGRVSYPRVLPLLRQQLNYVLHLIPTIDKIVPETRVGAAMVHASHAGDISEVSISTFLGVLLSELGITTAQNDVRLPLREKLVVPFLSPLNSKWPSWFLDDWKAMGARFDNFESITDGDRTDFRTASNAISGEYRGAVNRLEELQDILARIPTESTVHFVLTRSLDRSTFQYIARSPGDFLQADMFSIRTNPQLNVNEVHRSHPGMDKVIRVVVIDLRGMAL